MNMRQLQYFITELSEFESEEERREAIEGLMDVVNQFIK